MAKDVDLDEIQNPDELGGVDDFDQTTDDLMPNSVDAFIPEETEEQQQEEHEERAIVTGATPYIDRLLGWFQEQIDMCDSVKNVLATKDKSNLDLENTMVAHDIVRQLLEDKLTELINDKETWIDKPQR